MVSKRQLLTVWLTGLMSGFTIMITGNTLNFWLAKEEIEIRTIGIFALISVPYAINFIWAPVFDIIKIPMFAHARGQRVCWLIIIQIFLGISVYCLSSIEPAVDLLLFAFMGLIVSFLSSAQDTVLGAYRAEIIVREKQGQVSGIYIFGYRIGMLLASSGAIYIAAYISWQLVYKLFSFIIISFPIMLLLFTSKAIDPPEWPDKSSRDPAWGGLLLKTGNLTIAVLTSFGSRKYIFAVLIFLILYRLPDNFIGLMINPFLLHIGYDEFEIATAGKSFGIAAAIIGGIIAGAVMRYFDILRSLLFFGIMHAFAHILFIFQEMYGKNIYILFLTTGFESLTSGMTMAAYIGYITSLCHGRFKATQYSFLTSMMGLSRSVLPTISGYIVADLGWKAFYFFASLATLPSLILILYLRKISNNKTGTD